MLSQKEKSSICTFKYAKCKRVQIQITHVFNFNLQDYKISCFFCSKQFACKVFVMLGKLEALQCATCIREKIYNVALK